MLVVHVYAYTTLRPVQYLGLLTHPNESVTKHGPEDKRFVVDVQRERHPTGAATYTNIG